MRVRDLLRPTPHPRLAWLRAHEPVSWSSELSAWLVTRHADIVTISTRPETWSSAAIAEIEDLTHCEFPGVGRDLPLDLLRLDPPCHRSMRRPLARLLTPSRVARWGDTIDDGVAAAFDSLAATLRSDGTFALQASLLDGLVRRALVPVLLPRAVNDEEPSITLALGNTVELRDALARLISQLRPSGGTGPGGWPSGGTGPGGWPSIAALLAQTDLPPAHAGSLLAAMLGASDGTVRALLSGIVFVAQADPSMLTLLRSAPGRAPDVLEEIIRWWTPVRAMARTAVGTQRIGEVMVASGQPVVLLYSSGNRDQSAFGENADVFMIDRFVRERPAAHLGFGIGEHYCVGAALARRIGLSFLQTLAARARSVSFAGPISMYPGPSLSVFDAALRLEPVGNAT